MTVFVHKLDIMKIECAQRADLCVSNNHYSLWGVYIFCQNPFLIEIIHVLMESHLLCTCICLKLPLLCILENWKAVANNYHAGKHKLGYFVYLSKRYETHTVSWGLYDMEKFYTTLTLNLCVESMGIWYILLTKDSDTHLGCFHCC